MYIKEIEVVYKVTKTLDDLTDNKKKFYKLIIKNKHKDYIEDKDNIE